MKKITLIPLLILCVFMLFGCGCQHNWKEATCTEPKKCLNCNETEGEALGHSWVDATCTSPRMCSTCNKTEGEKLEHLWIEATFEAPKTCSLCAETDGNPLNIAEFETMLKETPVYVESTNLLIQHKQYKSLYPDVLTAVVKNNSGTSVKDIVVSFVAWDSNDLPIKIYGYMSVTGGNYVQGCNYTNVNLVHGATSEKDRGLATNYDYTGDIATFKAIVREYTDFDGNTWKNPYYNLWCDLYEGKTLTK